MNMITFELRLVAQSRRTVAALVLMALVCVLSLWTGTASVAQQQQALERIDSGQRETLSALARKYQGGGDAGSIAYATEHLTTNPPAPLAFAAFGQRDIQPYSLRVRLLGLQSQLYESELVNPELAVAGRFDFAFVLAYLAPLFVIIMMHDLVASERATGRLRLLASMTPHPALVWCRRIAVRFALIFAAVALPFCAFAAARQVELGDIGMVSLTIALYLAFWFGLSAAVAALTRTSVASAATMLAALVTLTMIVPTMLDAAIGRMQPVSKGVELALAQREQVHGAWDIPKADTFRRFFRSHPEWSDTPPVTGRFHWKWYFAMHQAGDDAVAGMVAQYRGSMTERERLSGAAGWLLPSVNVQVLLHRMADTDLQAQLAYQDRVGAHHAALRRYFYPYLFKEQPFGPAQFAGLPVYRAANGASRPHEPVIRLALLVLLSMGAAAFAMARIRP